MLCACASGPPAATRLLTQDLLGPDDGARRAALGRLAALDRAAKARHLGLLVRAARGDDPALEVRAFQALGALCGAGPARARDLCGGGASTEDVVARMQAQALGGDAAEARQDVVGLLVEALRKADDATADAVQAVFGKLGAPGPALDGDIARLLSSDRLSNLPSAVVRPGSPEALGLPDAVWTIRAANAAGVALERLSPGIAAPPFQGLLRDQSWFPRVFAATALGTLGEAARPSVPALLEALADRDFNVRDQALRSLKALGADADEIDGALKKACAKGAAGTLQTAADCAQAAALARATDPGADPTLQRQAASLCSKARRRAADFREECGDPGAKELGTQCRERFADRCKTILEGSGDAR